jgi:superfamily I DNA/RNA helicase
MKLTEEGVQIVQAIRAGESIGVQGISGSGKSSVVMTGAYWLDQQNKKTLILAFNSTIAKEFNSKCSTLTNVNALTFNALAMRYLGIPYKKLTSTWAFDVKVQKFIKRNIPKIINARDVSKVTNKITGKLYEFLKSGDAPTSVNSSMFNEILPKLNKISLKVITQELNNIVRAVQSRAMLGDFGHTFNTTLKLVATQNPLQDYGTVIISEIQDVNGVMLQLVKGFKGQLVIEGDSNQSIYGFLGAVPDVFSKLDVTQMGLTQSFRNTVDVTNASAEIVRLLNNTKDSPKFKGKCNDVESVENTTVLARFNSVLIEEALNTKKLGYSVDVSHCLGYIKKAINISKFKYDKEVEKQETKLIEKYYRNSISSTEIKPDFNKKAKEIVDAELGTSFSKDKLKELVKDSTPNADYTFYTIHKSKGMTFGKVEVVYHSETMRVPINDLLNEPEELRLLYVAITRTSTTVSVSKQLQLSLLSKELDLSKYNINYIRPKKRKP